MTKKVPDYSGLKKTEPSNADLEQLSTLAARLFKENKAVEEAEEKLKEAKKAATQTSEKDIPELMAQVGMKTFETKTGLKISIKKVIRASITQAKKIAAHKWIVDNGHGGMLKRSVMVAFNTDQAEEALALRKRLEGEFDMVKDDTKVESSTLRAFIKRELEAGHEVPMELFGAHEQKRTTLKISGS
jgi:hypothetical protein